MKLVHVIRRIHAVSCSEGAEHLGWQFEIYHVDHLIAVETELAAGHTHHDCVPLAVIAVTEHGGFEVLIEGIIGDGVVGGEAVGEEGLFGHWCFLFLISFNSMIVSYKVVFNLSP